MRAANDPHGRLSWLRALCVTRGAARGRCGGKLTTPAYFPRKLSLRTTSRHATSS